MERSKYYDWLRLVSVKGLGPETIQKLLTKYSTPGRIFKTSKDELTELSYISYKLAGNILENQKEEFIENQLALLEKHNVRLLSILDDEYPRLLKYSYNPPIVLYIKGELLPEDELTFAVVGTRKPTQYGKIAVRRIVPKLALAGFTIVSGLAYGIDGAAHHEALNAGGRTVAVFGTGLDIVYPSAHRELAERVLTNGAIISELPLGSKIEAWNFANRNRIISGMSKGTLVVEGAKTSGALLTSKFALEQNRDIYAIPGNINSPQSEGPNYLIKLGAKIVRNPDDILEEYQLKLKLVNENKSADEKPKVKLSTGEEKIYKLLMKHENNLSLDKMVELTDDSPATLSSVLLQMEFKGLVKRGAQNRYWLI